MLTTKVVRWGVVCSLLALGACSAGVDQVSDEDHDVHVSNQDLAIDSDTLWRPLWTGLTRIPVCFVGGTTAQRSNVRTVAEGSWEAIGATFMGLNGRYGVDFTGWGTCPSSTTDTIRVVFNNGGPNRVVGGLGRTMDFMDLSITAPNDTIMHEFGHALGFTHEFLRSDYSTVDPDCTASGGTVPDLGISGADTASIMNYVSCGRAGTLTFADILSFASLYGPWDVAYGARLAIRHDGTWNYVRGDADPDVSSASIGASREWVLERVAGPSSNLQFGDSVRLRANDGRYLRSNGAGAFVTLTSSVSGATTWQVFGRITTGQVRVNDEVLFRANDFNYLRVGGSNRLITGAGQIFRLIHLAGAINL